MTNRPWDPRPFVDPVESRSEWRERRELLLHHPWEEAQTLKMMSRVCQHCQNWTIWDYFEDVEYELVELDGGWGTRRVSHGVWGVCFECGNTVIRMRKSYILNMLNNPVHAMEEVFWEDPSFQSLVSDRLIDVGYEPPEDPFVHMTRPKRRSTKKRG